MLWKKVASLLKEKSERYLFEERDDRCNLTSELFQKSSFIKLERELFRLKAASL